MTVNDTKAASFRLRRQLEGFTAPTNPYHAPVGTRVRRGPKVTQFAPNSLAVRLQSGDRFVLEALGKPDSIYNADRFIVWAGGREVGFIEERQPQQWEAWYKGQKFAAEGGYLNAAMLVLRACLA
jgi:hypothetical protein